MKTKDLNIIREEEMLDEMSMDNIKGGLAGESQLCCIINSHCNENGKEKSDEEHEDSDDNGGL